MSDDSTSSLQISWLLWASRAPSTLTGSIWRWTPIEPRSIRSCLSLWSTRWSYEWQAEWGGQPTDYVAPRCWLTYTPRNKCTDTHLHIHIHTASTTESVLQAIGPGSSGVFSRFGGEKTDVIWCVEKGKTLSQGSHCPWWTAASWAAH